MNLGFSKLIHWAESIDVHEIRATSKTTKMSLLKRFGFKINSYLMHREISSA
jgi:hypothetical protein